MAPPAQDSGYSAARPVSPDTQRNKTTLPGSGNTSAIDDGDGSSLDKDT